MSKLAPVVIFAYRRPDHLRNTLDGLMRCEGFRDSPVLVYCDGPRNDGERKMVMATRKLARKMLGDSAEYHFSEVNLGLSRSVITGVTEAANRFGRAIVVEDDLELSPDFLSFMNRALDRYAEEERVFQVSGYQFDVPELENTVSALFLPFAASWGWATWKRAWDQFDPMAAGWEAIRTDRNLRQRFNLDGTYDYATMLMRQMAGLRDSWAVRWYWTLFKAGGLVLFPPVSLVTNAGFDGSGTHGQGLLRNFSTGVQVTHFDITLPDIVRVDGGSYDAVKKTLRRRNGGLAGKLIDKLRWLKTVYSGKQKVRA
jgi:GNT-I family